MDAIGQILKTALAQPVEVLWGVGPERMAQLARLGIRTIEELLLHQPRRHEDRRHFRRLADLNMEEAALTRGNVVAKGLKRLRKGTKTVFELVLEDGTARLHCRWWNLPFLEKCFEVGDEVVVFGKLGGMKPRTMDHPETEVVLAGAERFVHFGRITPVYPLTEGLPQRWLRGLMWRALERHQNDIREPWGYKPGERTGTRASGTIQSTLPSRADAIRMMHFPGENEEIERSRQRLALDELVELQVNLQGRRKRFEAQARAHPCGGDQNRLIRPFLKALGYHLTGGQTKVLREIRQDLSGTHPMRRLLQGDVGSGKTVVAACAALMAIERGFNVALMVPTEILAEQHYARFQEWFEPLEVPVAIRTGAKKETRGESGGPRWGEPGAQNQGSLTIGTHALLTSGFEMPRLGLAIMDEQHKFGVAQRETLVRKGNYPHVLVMTATPIPRTLGLTLYGDLDVSVIEGKPAGRGQTRTCVRTEEKLPEVWQFLRQQLARGRQAYVVYPRVEETEGGEVKALLKEWENVKQQVVPFPVGVLHGRQSASEKEAVMAAFRQNTVKVLLATSLIEVGVDVPNATVMLIESAERFGLPQLHQLRGRIGRGAADAQCILVTGVNTAEVRERLQVLEETNDGFRLAEEDLKRRGPGELLGSQQSGQPRFRFANLLKDTELILESREIAGRIVAGKMQMSANP